MILSAVMALPSFQTSLHVIHYICCADIGHLAHQLYVEITMHFDLISLESKFAWKDLGEVLMVAS